MIWLNQYFKMIRKCEDDIHCILWCRLTMISTCLYDLIEQVKNGRTLAGKFDSKELKFHTPNIIVVFSNEMPDVDQLSKDRWKIFQIRDDELLDATDKYV